MSRTKRVTFRWSPREDHLERTVEAANRYVEEICDLEEVDSKRSMKIRYERDIPIYSGHAENIGNKVLRERTWETVIISNYSFQAERIVYEASGAVLTHDSVDESWQEIRAEMDENLDVENIGAEN